MSVHLASFKLKILYLQVFLICLIQSGIANGQQLATSKTNYTSCYRIDPKYPHYLSDKDKNYLFILNRTAWAYFACSYPEDVIHKAKDQGVTVIRVAIEGTPYKEVLKYDMWPWGGSREKPDYSKINEPYWNEVERRIRLAGENRIGINLNIYFTMKPKLEDATSQHLYWETLIKRLGKYPNILCWEIMNEYSKNEAFQDVAGEYFYKNDPNKRPVISSDGTTDDALWPDKQWMGMAIVHTCTGSIPEYDLNQWYNAIAKNTRSHGKPAFNNETGREIRHKNDDGVHRRKQSWLSNTAGCFWTHHTWDGCEGINDTTYVSPGQEFLRPLSDFFQSIPFWTLQPNYSVCQVSNDSFIMNTMCDPSRNLCISYVCIRKTGNSTKGLQALYRLPDGTYRIEFFNPANNLKISEQTLVSTNLRNQYPVIISDFTDDILLKVTKTKTGDKTVIPGTL
jgi:hypothetical protein